MLNKIIRVVKNGGMLSLAKESVLFVLKIASYPYALMRVKKEEPLAKSIDFAMEGAFGLIRPLQHKSEIAGLINEVSKVKPKTILEIGTAQGGTLYLTAKAAAPDAEIFSIDLPGGEFGGGYPSWKAPLYRAFATKAQKIELIRADSHKKETFDSLKQRLGGRKLDFLFIDGDHTYEGVKRDYLQYSPLVRKGGLIALHDVAKHAKETGCEVDRFWKEVRGKKYTEFLVGNQAWGGIGLLRK